MKQFLNGQKDLYVDGDPNQPISNPDKVEKDTLNWEKQRYRIRVLTLLKEAETPLVTIENCKAVLRCEGLSEEKMIEMIDLKHENEQIVLDIAQQIKDVLDNKTT